MKTYLSLFLFLAVFCIKNSGQTITVLSAVDNSPIPSAHVRYQLQNEAKEQVFITDKTGQVVLPIVTVEHPVIFITISFLGYEKLTDTLRSHSNKTYRLKEEKTILNDFVVTAQYAPNSPEKSVHKVKIIDAKKIQSMGAQNLRDVLTNEMNIRISQDNILGSGMSLQGISGQNVKILIDGVPVTGRLNGNVDISQINMNNVERIEIVEGPLSVNFGTDALAGTINIITKKTQKENFHVALNSYYESLGQYNFSGKIGLQKGKNLISLSGGRNYFDGWRTNDQPFFVEKDPIADSTRFKNWKPKEQYFGALQYKRLFKELTLVYSSDYFYEDVLNRGMPRAPYFITAFDDNYYTYRINNSINAFGKIKKDYYINITAAYNHFKRIKNTHYKDLTTLEQVLTENPSDQDTSIFNTMMSRGSISYTKAQAKIHYEVGYDVNYEKSMGIRIRETTQFIGDYALFSSAEYQPIKDLVIRPGLRLMHNTAYQAPLIPSINVKYVKQNKNSKSNYTFRASYARGFRAPSLKELYFYFVDINHNITGNEDLKAERSHNFNFTTSFNHHTEKWIYKTELSLFYNNIDNMISLAQASNTEYSYFNIEKFQSMGVQLSNDLSFGHLKLAIGGAYIGRYNQWNETMNSEKMLFAPEGRFNVFYEWHKHQLTAALFYKYTGKLPSVGINGAELYATEIQDYHTADASVSKAFLNRKINLSLGVKNLFNVTNINGIATGGAHSGAGNSIAVGMGRTYFLKLDFQLDAQRKQMNKNE